jgi:hypothetical protein
MLPAPSLIVTFAEATVLPLLLLLNETVMPATDNVPVLFVTGGDVVEVAVIATLFMLVNPALSVTLTVAV